MLGLRERCCQDGEHVGIIHCRLFRLLLETALRGGFPSESIEGKPTNQSQIVRRVQRSHPTLIFAKGDIQHPMLRIFDAPMLADYIGAAGIIHCEASEIKLNFMGRFVLQLPGAFDDDNRLQSQPLFALVEGWQLV